MTAYTEQLIADLTTLNQIADTLNQSVDVHSALNTALARLVELMGLETGWIFLKDPSAKNQWFGRGYRLAAHVNLPPALGLHKASAWKGGCDCQGFCNKEALTEAHNEVRCSRLAEAKGEDRAGLVVHASAPLRSRNQLLGILNVAAPDWESFTPEALALLTNVGSQMGIALERARLFDMVRERRILEQATLLEFSNQLLSRRSLDDLVDYLVSEIRNLLQVDASALIMPSAQPEHLSFYAAGGWRSDPVAQGRLLPADESSGPALVMSTQQPLLAEDIEAMDPTTFMPDWLQGEGFRGHAIVPLIVEGRSVGSLVINCRQPRLLEADELRLLQLMANQAAIALEEARRQEEERKHQRLEEELALSKRIQLSMLPKAHPRFPGWEFATVYQAARVVGGDFYDLFHLPNDTDRLGLVIADVTDKGVPAALFMALSRTIIRTTALTGHGPANVLMRANQIILSDSQTDLFLSAFYAILDTRTGRLVYANGGHNRPLWYHAATGQLEELAANGIILGAFPDIALEEREVDTAPNDILFFYTDGLTEAYNAQGEMFGLERLVGVIRKHAQHSAEEIRQAVVDGYNDFTGDTEQSDDVTFLVVKRQGNENC